MTQELIKIDMRDISAKKIKDSYIYGFMQGCWLVKHKNSEILLIGLDKSSIYVINKSQVIFAENYKPEEIEGSFMLDRITRLITRVVEEHNDNRIRLKGL